MTLYTIIFPWNLCLASLWRKLSTFEEGVMQNKIIATPMPTLGFQATTGAAEPNTQSAELRTHFLSLN